MRSSPTPRGWGRRDSHHEDSLTGLFSLVTLMERRQSKQTVKEEAVGESHLRHYLPPDVPVLLILDRHDLIAFGGVEV